MAISPYSDRIQGDLLQEYQKQRIRPDFPTLCFAPFRNIYFGHFGKAVACCYNRDFVLGTWPQQSIREIWEGDKAQQLRKALQNDYLGLGCENCSTHFHSRNWEALKAKQYDETPQNHPGFPSVMEFELSNSCNLECSMCSGEFSSSIRKNREQLPPLKSPYNEGFVAQLEEFIPHLSETKFYGGEPFLINIYYQIWDRILALKPDCRISIQTNGSIMNPKVRKLVQNGQFHLNVSIDSLDPENYRKIRVNGELAPVLENFEFFRQECRKKNTFIGLSACILQSNWWEMPHFVRFCNEKEVPVYFHTVFHPQDQSLWSLPPQKLAEVVASLQQQQPPEGKTALERKNRQQYLQSLRTFQNWLEINQGQKPHRVWGESGEDPFAFLIPRIYHYFIQKGSENLETEVEITLQKCRNLLQVLTREHDTALIVKMMKASGKGSIISAVNSRPIEELYQEFIAHLPV